MRNLCQIFVVVGVSALFLATATFGQPVQVVGPESVGLSARKLAGIDRIMEEAIAAKVMPGAVVLVARHGRVAFFKPFGIEDFGKPMRTDALFRICSMTNSDTALGALILFEEGHFTLDEPLSNIIPEFADLQVAVNH